MLISIYPESMNPRLPCDLYEPWTCIFHPLTHMAIQVHPEGSGVHKKGPFQEIHIMAVQYKDVGNYSI